MNTYTKQPLSIEDQIARLRLQGLVIADEAYAKRVLGEVSYFRFAAYLRPMEADKQTHQFKPGSTFDNAVQLYEFDNELRQLLFSAIGRIGGFALEDYSVFLYAAWRILVHADAVAWQ